MNREKAILTMTYHSPCGDLLLGSYEGALCPVRLGVEAKRAVTDAMIRRLSGVGYIAVPSEVTRLAARQLDEYFAGCRRYFDVPLRMFGTEFRRRVWQAIGRCLMVIRYHTASWPNAWVTVVPCVPSPPP